MGVIISKFRKQKSTIEVLEQLEKEISKLQHFRRQNQEYQKKFVASLILYSIIIYILAAVIFYFYYFPNSWSERILYFIPLLLFPVLVWIIKKISHWYFVKRIASNDIALQELREKKKDILEQVMETETYKKAREILEKFDPQKFKKLETPARITQSTPGAVVRQRTVVTRTVTPAQQQIQTPTRPVSPLYSPRQQMISPATPMSVQNGRQGMMIIPRYGRSPGPPLPRPIPARERNTLDKFVDYLTGDGPQTRFALICKYCHSHNGMALKEEFEFLNFRCCYCYHLNPARKQRPHAPKLEFLPPNLTPVSAPEGHKDTADDDAESAVYASEDEGKIDEAETKSSGKEVDELNNDDEVTEVEEREVENEEVEQTGNGKDDNCGGASNEVLFDELSGTHDEAAAGEYKSSDNHVSLAPDNAVEEGADKACEQTIE